MYEALIMSFLASERHQAPVHLQACLPYLPNRFDQLEDASLSPQVPYPADQSDNMVYQQAAKLLQLYPMLSL